MVQSNLWVVGCATALFAWVGLAIKGRIDGIGLSGAALFLFVIYTLDRYRSTPEDQRDAPVDLDPSAFVARHRVWFRAALILALAGLVGLGCFRPRFFLSLLAAFTITAFYLVPVPFLGRRLKELPFFKNAYAPLSVVLLAMVFLECWPTSLSGAAVLGSAVLLCQLNAWTFDLKDIEGDRGAGIRLLSTILEPRTLIHLLLIESVLLAGLFVVFLPAPWHLGASLAAIGNVLSLMRMRRRFDLHWLFLVHEAMLAVPFLVFLASRWIPW